MVSGLLSGIEYQLRRTDILAVCLPVAQNTRPPRVLSTPAVDRDLVAEAPRTVGHADETGLRRRGRPFLLRLPESADGGNP
jgi:hypothetical protein